MRTLAAQTGRRGVLLTFWAVAFLFHSAVAAALAEVHHGLLGESRVRLDGGVILPGDKDVEEIDDTIPAYQALVNIPLHQQVDARIFAAYTELSGSILESFDVKEEVYSAGGALVVYFPSDSTVTPYFLLGALYQESDYELRFSGEKVMDDRDDETGGLFGIGFEIALAEQTSLLAEATASTIDDEEVSAGLLVQHWLVEHVGLSAQATYFTDQGDIFLGGGVDLGF